MDIPFLSSSAISREHYNLVQSIEAAPTLQRVDDILVHKIGVVKKRFDKGPGTSSECVSSLILLLYCWTATSLGQVTRTALEFALPHAVTLAEAGSTLKEKRIGYQFCTEVMDISDELQLMLVNTLRKDLEDNNPARICLALDVLLVNCPVEVIPAVSPRLINLLTHDSSHVKRKAIAVIRLLSRHEFGVLTNLYDMIKLRLGDEDLYVAAAALGLLHELSRARILKPRKGVDLIFADFLSLQAHTTGIQRPRLQLVNVTGKLICESLLMDPVLEITADFVDVLFRIIESATDADQAFVLECIRTVSQIPTPILKQRFKFNGSKALSSLGQLFNSQEPNTQYLSITCLLELDPVLWTGNTADLTPVYDERQVHTIMTFLDSSDSIIRAKTLQVLNRVDRELLLVHLTQLTSAFPASTSREEYRLAARVLEVFAVYEQNGGAYANRLREVCIRTSGQEGNKGKQGRDGGVRLVSENLVEQVLLHLNSSPDSFREEFVDAIVRIPVSDAGPTLTLVIAATVCEYGALSTIPQRDLLQGLAARLEDAPPAIQEALLLTMLRVTARCASVYGDVTDQVRKLYDISRRHIRRRCDQYLTYSEKMTTLSKIVECAKSDTLPDFLLALETMDLRAQGSPSTLPGFRHDSAGSEKSRSPSAHGKLRYDAYEPPPPAFRLTRRASSATSVDSHGASSHSSHSGKISPYSHSHEFQSTTFGTSGDSMDRISRTLTAGDLALAAHELDFSRSGLIDSSTEPLATNIGHHPVSDPIASEVLKTDLIALESPFIAEPLQPLGTGVRQSSPTVDFESIWESLKGHPSARGWCQSGIEELEQRIRDIATYAVMSLPPGVLQVDTKLLLSSQSGLGMTRETGLLAAIRLRPGEEGSALWQMRCLDAKFKAVLKNIFDDN